MNRRFLWSSRKAHVRFSDEEWFCLDNGEGELIPIGTGGDGEHRANHMSELLNLGMAVWLKEDPQRTKVLGAIEVFHTSTEAMSKFLDSEDNKKLPPSEAVDKLIEGTTKTFTAINDLEKALAEVGK